MTAKSQILFWLFACFAQDNGVVYILLWVCYNVTIQRHIIRDTPKGNTLWRKRNGHLYSAFGR